MKTIVLFSLLTGLIMVSCKEEQNPDSDNFKLLTTPVWTSDSLLVDGTDAGSGLLENFKGDAKFNKDYTGTFR